MFRVEYMSSFRVVGLVRFAVWFGVPGCCLQAFGVDVSARGLRMACNSVRV